MSEPARARSPEERLRLQGALRGIVIAWGVGIATFLTRRSGAESALDVRGILTMVFTGLALQALLFLVRAGVRRYERSAGLEGQLMPLAMYLFGLAVDAVTVLLFAIATYRGILQFADAV